MHTGSLAPCAELSSKSRLQGVVFGTTLELGAVILEQRRLQADHADKPLEYTWKTLATSVRIPAAQEKLTSKLSG